MKTKVSRRTVRAFLTMITKKKRPRKNRVDKETKFAGELQKLYKAERTESYSTMSEPRHAFAERTMRSQKKTRYRYREDYG